MEWELFDGATVSIFKVGCLRSDLWMPTILRFPWVNQLMANWWFGFLGSPYERAFYIEVPHLNPEPPGPKPPIYHQLKPST